MSVNLEKGQKVDLTKGNSKLKRIMVGLGWDEVEDKKTGFFAKLTAAPKVDIDCDASAILLSAGGKLASKDDLVYFGNLTHNCGCVKHMGDNLTGAGDGDDEQIWVDLLDIPGKFEKIVFVVNIYDAVKRGQHFGLIKNAFIRLVDADTNVEICKYNLSNDYDNRKCVIFGEMYRYNNEWKFSALGEGTNDDGLGELVRKYT